MMQVTIKTLRHYERLGLLVPYEVDEWTGYRYYSIEQMQRLGLIRGLQRQGFTLEEIKDFCSVMNFAQPILAAEGIKLGYHNHSHEFALMPWGSTAHSEIERNTDIEFEIDTFWAYHAGVDPVGVLERLKDRISVIHVKDGFADGRGMPLGEGEAPVIPVCEAAQKYGFKMVVESETLTPSGLDEAERCIKYLRSI